MREVDEIPATVDTQLDLISKASDLREVNALLTELMGKQKIQALIKDENLGVVRDAVMDLALIGEGDDAENRLMGAAVLGRLAAVARARESIVFERLDELFEEMPLPIGTLSDTDEKYYAALCIESVESDWLIDYACVQAIELDTSEQRARRIFLGVVLRETGNLSEFWQKLTAALDPVKAIEKEDPRYNRIRRITTETVEVVRAWDGSVGTDAGIALAEWAGTLLRTSRKGVGNQVVFDIVDHVIGMLLRIVELRFSNALLSETYDVVARMQRILGRELWDNAVDRPNRFTKLRICLEEAALVLARQTRTDRTLMKTMKVVFSHDAQMKASLRDYFSSALELDPQIREWWTEGGEATIGGEDVQQQFGNSEDQQIGSLLINVEESKVVMEKLERAVVPYLEISDPHLAATVKRAAVNYAEIALATKQLASIRKLRRMELKGKTIEYDPVKQDMLGDRRLGVRMVRVERDGVEKNFGGKIKVLVKPRVTPGE